jgi:Skp family chaperone for outer membrane proteins
MFRLFLLVLVGLSGLSQNVLAGTVSENSETVRLCVVDLDVLQKPYREKIEVELSKVAEGFKAEFSDLETSLKNEKEELDLIKQNLQKNPKMTEPEGWGSDY